MARDSGFLPPLPLNPKLVAGRKPPRGDSFLESSERPLAENFESGVSQSGPQGSA